MTDIITKAGSYRTVDGRRIEVEMRGSDMAVATNLECMDHRGEGRALGSSQKYYLNGNVIMQRPGEENDRIVGPWVHEITIGGKYRASTGFATVRCVADDHVFYVREDGTAGTLKVDDFFKHFTFVPPTKTVWVNLWWKSGAYVDTGATHETEEAARNVNNKPDHAVYIKTISLEVPA